MLKNANVDLMSKICPKLMLQFHQLGYYMEKNAIDTAGPINGLKVFGILH